MKQVKPLDITFKSTILDDRDVRIMTLEDGSMAIHSPKGGATCSPDSHHRLYAALRDSLGYGLTEAEREYLVETKMRFKGPVLHKLLDLIARITGEPSAPAQGAEEVTVSERTIWEGKSIGETPIRVTFWDDKEFGCYLGKGDVLLSNSTALGMASAILTAAGEPTVDVDGERFEMASSLTSGVSSAIWIDGDGDLVVEIDGNGGMPCGCNGTPSDTARFREHFKRQFGLVEENEGVDVAALTALRDKCLMDPTIPSWVHCGINTAMGCPPPPVANTPTAEPAEASAVEARVSASVQSELCDVIGEVQKISKRLSALENRDSQANPLPSKTAIGRLKGLHDNMVEQKPGWGYMNCTQELGDILIDSCYPKPDADAVERFRKYLDDCGVHPTVRRKFAELFPKDAV